MATDMDGTILLINRARRSRKNPPAPLGGRSVSLAASSPTCFSERRSKPPLRQLDWRNADVLRRSAAGRCTLLVARDLTERRRESAASLRDDRAARSASCWRQVHQQRAHGPG